jgi:hypothetical protein
MYLLIRGIVIFAALAPLVATAQVASASSPQDTGRVHRHKASLVPPPPPPAPEVVEPLPEALAPLTSADLPAQPPRVTFRDGVLTVDAQNSTLSDILKAIRTLVGAEFDPMPEVAERTVVHLSGSPNDVISGLLRGSAYGYVLISSQEDSSILQKVLLIAPEPVAGAKSAAVRAATSRPVPMPVPVFSEPAAVPASPLPTSPAPASNETASPVAELATTATVNPENVATPPKDPAAVSPTSFAQAQEILAATPLQQQGITLPDPVQFMERANQQNLANPDKTQQPMSSAGQYLQELYKLRVQQQPGQGATAQSSAAAPPQ